MMTKEALLEIERLSASIEELERDKHSLIRLDMESVSQLIIDTQEKINGLLRQKNKILKHRSKDERH